MHCIVRPRGLKYQLIVACYVESIPNGGSAAVVRGGEVQVEVSELYQTVG